MPPGNNLGGQPNLLLFEVGMIQRDPFGHLPDIVKTVAIHPFVVGPSQWAYQDTARGGVQQTHGGSIGTRAGRALRQLTLQGSFGVESRGLGLYIGTGDLRFQRFYHEVVRLPSAVNKAQVDAEKDLFRSPFLSLALKPYNEENTTFYLNVFDLWHGVTFNGEVKSFRFTKGGKGSATGLTGYVLTIDEHGPIVTGALGTAIINALFQALRVWNSINEIIKSYTLDVIAGALVDAAGILVGEFVDSVNAVKAQIDGATALLNGYSQPEEAILSRTRGLFSNDKPSERKAEIEPLTDYTTNASAGLSGYLGATARMAQRGTDVRDALIAQLPGRELVTPGGAVAWDALEDDGGIPELDAVDAIDGITEVIAAADGQRAMGAFYGMSRAEFAAYLASTGAGGRDPGLAGSFVHVVTPFDTMEGITRAYRVSWDRILRVNDYTPDEALLPGTRLTIPQERAVGAPAPLEGLPTFGSHVGREAWGRDLWADLRVVDGAFVVCEGEDLLKQGIDWTITQFADEFLALANETPDPQRADVLRTRVSAVLLSDKRLAAVDRVDVLPDDSGAGLRIEVTATAINDGTVSTARAA